MHMASLHAAGHPQRARNCGDMRCRRPSLAIVISLHTFPRVSRSIITRIRRAVVAALMPVKCTPPLRWIAT
jgi:hypothetical protein